MYIYICMRMNSWDFYQQVIQSNPSTIDILVLTEPRHLFEPNWSTNCFRGLLDHHTILPAGRLIIHFTFYFHP